MNRKRLIQEIFQRTNFQNYLEIGCHAGKTFLPVKAKNKIAVDPDFKIPVTQKVKWIFKEPKNLGNKYFEETSDDFFLKRKKYLQKLGQLDVVLVDGLHEFRAALSDVLNSLEYLNKDGVIIMHDCYPPNKAAALPAKNFPTLEDRIGVEGWTGQWCGDVWKTIVYLRKNLSEFLDVCVINTDFGLGIIRPKSRINKEGLIIDEKSFLEIEKLTYDELMQDTKSMLDLKDSEYAISIIDEISAQKQS